MPKKTAREKIGAQIKKKYGAKGGASAKYAKGLTKAISGFAGRRAALGTVSRATAGTKNTGARGMVGRGSALGASLRKTIAKGDKAGAAKIRAKMSSSLVKRGLATVREKGAKFSSGRTLKSNQTVLNRTGRPDRDSGLDRSK